VTVTQGTNRIVENDPERVVKETVAVLDGKGESGCALELWDGQAAYQLYVLRRAGDLAPFERERRRMLLAGEAI
jgi:hypothetical protein